MLRLVRSEKFDFPSEQWDMISDSAKDLVRGLLTVDHRRRFTVSDEDGYFVGFVDFLDNSSACSNRFFHTAPQNT